MALSARALPRLQKPDWLQVLKSWDLTALACHGPMLSASSNETRLVKSIPPRMLGYALELIFQKITHSV